MLIGVGVWCLEDTGSRSEAWFDDLAFGADVPAPGAPAVTLDDRALPLDERVFATEFGAWYAGRRDGDPEERQAQKKKKGKKT
jgi:hypothetical protein